MASAIDTNFLRLKSWEDASVERVYEDILELFSLLETSTLGTLKKEMPLTLLLTPRAAAYLGYANGDNVSVYDMLMREFSFLTIKAEKAMGDIFCVEAMILRRNGSFFPSAIAFFEE